MIEELIARLEKATGPDRELDGLIYGLLNNLKRNGGTFYIRDKFQFEHPTLRHPSGPGALYVADTAVAEFTASIDAALTLVPEDKEWRVGTQAHRGGYSATIWVNISSLHITEHADGPTPAITLCIAALKARLALKEKSK